MISILTFWKRKFLNPFLNMTDTQLTAQSTTSTSVTPGACWPVSNAVRPTSFVPIHNVRIVSSGFSLSDPFAFSAKNNGSWLSNREGKGSAVRLLEHVAPERANGERLKCPSAAAKTGQATPPSPVLTYRGSIAY